VPVRKCERQIFGLSALAYEDHPVFVEVGHAHDFLA
jgi:hypothetical protein